MPRGEVPLRGIPRGEVPLCEDGHMKARAVVAGRQTLVWAALGVCSVMLVKAVVIGGLGSASFALLDPRFGGVDGLGVLTNQAVAPGSAGRQQELATVGGGSSFDSFRSARGVAGLVPTHTVQGGVFGDGAAGRLPGVNQNAWLASRSGEGVHFFDRKPSYRADAEAAKNSATSAYRLQGKLLDAQSAYRTAQSAYRTAQATPHPRRPSRLHRVSAENAQGALASSPSAPVYLSKEQVLDMARMVSRDNLKRERARLAALNAHYNADGVLGRMPQATTSQILRSKDEFDNSAGGALFRASTTATSTGGSLSANFKSDVANANGALAAVPGDDKSWAQPSNDNGWAQATKDNGWATPTHDNGWATESKQNGWASAVHDNGWASAPSASASHGALLSMGESAGNAMGSLSQLKNQQNAWSQEPSRAEKKGALVSMRSGHAETMGSLASMKRGSYMGSLSLVKARRENRLGSLSQIKTSHDNAMGSLASVKTDPETNGALAKFKQNQAETDGSLSTLKGDEASTDGSLSGIKGGSFEGSLAITKGSDAAGSLSDVKGSDVFGSLSGSKVDDMAGGVLSVTKNTLDVGGALSLTANKEDVGGSLAGYGKQGEMVEGTLANTKGSDVGGSLSDVKGSKVNLGGSLSDVKGIMVDGALSAVTERPQGLGWLAQAPGLRGRLVNSHCDSEDTACADPAPGVDADADDAHSARKASIKTGGLLRVDVPTVAKTAKEAQKTAEEAAALKYMLGKELNEATRERTVQAAEKKVQKQEQALEHLLKASKEQVEEVQQKVQAAAAKASSESKAQPATAASVKVVGEWADARGTAPEVALKRPKAAKAAKAASEAASAVGDTMHVAKGQLKKQQKLDDDDLGKPLDDNEDDIGWHKSHWSTLAWVMFIMFGPVFTTAVVGLVGYYTGTVAALATCLLLVCMDIACYYYSWFLW